MKSRFSLILLLFLGFIDYMGMGLVFPLFPTLFFDSSIPLLPPETSDSIRGLWMGILIALAPLAQFFASPILGSLSDQKGRKKIILFALSFGFWGYLLGIVAIWKSSLILLILYRCLFGVSSATMTLAQASIVDMSSAKEKAKYFGLYNMALGTGFTLGPFLGGKLSDPSILSWFDHSTPFFLGALLTGLNMALLYWKFKETRKVVIKTSIDIWKGFRDVKKALRHPALRITFLSIFFFLFGWYYFFEFASVLLKNYFAFTISEVGNFYAYSGMMYALCTGLLIRPFVKRYSSGNLLVFSMMTCGGCLLLFLTVKDPFYFWFYLPIINFVLAFFYPIASSFISDHATEDTQGEILGIYHSVQALALILSPLFFGTWVGKIPWMPVYLGSSFMILGGIIFTLNYLGAKRGAFVR